MSKWLQPEGFPGEVKAVRMPYRNMANGSRGPRPFFAYAYGFSIDPSKWLKSVTLPNDTKICVLAISLDDYADNHRLAIGRKAEFLGGIRPFVFVTPATFL